MTHGCHFNKKTKILEIFSLLDSWALIIVCKTSTRVCYASLQMWNQRQKVDFILKLIIKVKRNKGD